MRSLKTVYEKLKKQYKKLDMTFENNIIRININGYIIEANDKFVELSKGKNYVNHEVSKNYDEVYKTIKKYINNPKDSIVDNNKQSLIVFLVILVLLFIMAILIRMQG